MAFVNKSQVFVFLVLLLQLVQFGATVDFKSLIPRSKKVNGEYMYRHATDDWEKSGAVADRWEERKNGVVRGQYALLQPDGKIRTVDYIVHEPGKGPGGFKVVVRYWPGPQQLMSSMTLSETLANHPQPAINNYALYGKAVDDDQSERIRRSLKMYAPLREEMEEYKQKTRLPFEEDVRHVKARKFARRASSR
ncbi:uncharacterized protein LOC132198256 [Neocloeon triangulifer]|uniref:uncharacterized protein LOC132198256 n=1 Tax=Neocloeon triangulifer TaxID=2078957 RepID=UPI00286F5728|nr:uncharacterized protein LOC132198256 [Neocloeon triangulifer]